MLCQMSHMLSNPANESDGPTIHNKTLQLPPPQHLVEHSHQHFSAAYSYRSPEPLSCLVHWNRHLKLVSQHNAPNQVTALLLYATHLSADRRRCLAQRNQCQLSLRLSSAPHSMYIRYRACPPAQPMGLTSLVSSNLVDSGSSCSCLG